MNIIDKIAICDSAAMKDDAMLAAVMLDVLKITSRNITSMTAACNCNTYIEWQQVVDKAIKMAEAA